MQKKHWAEIGPNLLTAVLENINMAIDKKLYIYINHIWIVMSGTQKNFRNTRRLKNRYEVNVFQQ